jgi:FkbM family methyltransferase
MPAITAEFLIESTFAFRDSLTFVQVGAHNGIENDPLASLLKRNLGWGGLSIEPVPEIFETLKRNRGSSRNYAYANVAIGTHQGTAIFYAVAPNGDESWLSQVGSFSREHVERHIAGRSRCEIVEHRIHVQTFDSALRDAQITKFDLLIIDAEGYDLEILRQAVATLSTCRLVVMEVDHLSELDIVEATKIFSENDFTVFRVGGDFVAIRSPSRWIRVGYRDAIVA